MRVWQAVRTRLFDGGDRRCPLCSEPAVSTTADPALVRIGIATLTCANRHDWISKHDWSSR